MKSIMNTSIATKFVAALLVLVVAAAAVAGLGIRALDGLNG